MRPSLSAVVGTHHGIIKELNKETVTPTYCSLPAHEIEKELNKETENGFLRALSCIEGEA